MTCSYEKYEMIDVLLQNERSCSQFIRGFLSQNIGRKSAALNYDKLLGMFINRSALITERAISLRFAYLPTSLSLAVLN